MKKLDISYQALDLARFARLLENVPRELYNGCVRLYDYLTAHNKDLVLTVALIEQFALWHKAKDGGLTPLHQAYLEVLENARRPLGLKTIAIKLGLDEKTVEEDVEPLLVKLGLVERGVK